MAPPPESAAPLPSLLSITIRRGVLAGRFYLAIGVAVVVVLTVVLLHSAKASTVFTATFPLEVPIFASLGAMGGLMLFVSDRSKGVFEYLISYGVRPSTLFLNCLVVTVLLSTLVVGIALAIGVGGYVATGHPITIDFENALLGYTLPMAYASSLFSSVCGIIWSTLSTPRMGINSPVGVAPLLGIAPVILVLIVAESVPSSQYYDVTVGAGVGFIVLVGILLVVSTRLMGRERYLSPM